ncbi:MAG: putative membrane protein [Paracoccaceae bacterium]|jgi:uncharacterized membrane protein
MTLAPLAVAPAAVQIHAALALVAALLAAAILLRRKGTRAHKVMGRVWAALMAGTAAGSFLISGINPSGGFSAIHILSAATLITLAYAIRAVRRGNVHGHRIAMISLVFGALGIAGAFTLAPGRIMSQVVLGE